MATYISPWLMGVKSYNSYEDAYYPTHRHGHVAVRHINQIQRICQTVRNITYYVCCLPRSATVFILTFGVVIFTIILIAGIAFVFARMSLIFSPLLR